MFNTEPKEAKDAAINVGTPTPAAAKKTTPSPATTPGGRFTIKF